MTGILLLYIVCFVGPYLITLVTDEPKITVKVFQLCLLPQTVLLCIEIVQIYEGWRNYIKSIWNWIDVLQIVTF